MKIPQELLGRLSDSPPLGPAVYFLVIGEEVVYIGSSVMPASRVCHHRDGQRRVVDSVWFLPTSSLDMAESEKKYIRMFCPRHNKICNPSPSREYESWGNPVGSKTSTSVCSFRLDQETLDCLDAIAEDIGLTSRTAAIVYLARQAAREIQKTSA